MLIFEKQVEQLTGRSITMGTEEYLLERERERGLQKGLKEGKLENAFEIAFELKKRGLSTQDISNITGLALKEGKEQIVRNIINQLDLEDTQIAEIVEVSEDFVEKVRAAFKKW